MSIETRSISRRSFFDSVGTGLHGAALTWLLGRDVYASDSVPAAEQWPVPQRRPSANAVIHLFMNGGPSQMDLFDPKPMLDRHHGQEHFKKIAGEVEFPEQAGALMKSAFRFAQHGQCGMWMSDAMPHLVRHVDKLAMIRSMHTTNLTHEPALYKIHSGSEFLGHPSLGAWVSYGLGTE
ncbi:MAG: DUF1501 domain-containing protein, partial [Verrucomicrobiae bacterium]|nr:DUF1501 domain-containing protein [Verrucomicrobiae bacterium]